MTSIEYLINIMCIHKSNKIKSNNKNDEIVFLYT